MSAETGVYVHYYNWGAHTLIKGRSQTLHQENGLNPHYHSRQVKGKITHNDYLIFLREISWVNTYRHIAFRSIGIPPKAGGRKPPKARGVPMERYPGLPGCYPPNVPMEHYEKNQTRAIKLL